MPLSAAMPFLVDETKQVAVQREVPGFLRKRHDALVRAFRDLREPT